jgi:hypothetical protein
MPRAFLPFALAMYTVARVVRVAMLTQVDAATFFRGLSRAPGRFPLWLPRIFGHSFDGQHLPLHEWVSNRCKAFTLPQRPACVAFTIRAWSRRTMA